MSGDLLSEVTAVAADVFGVDGATLGAASGPEDVEAWDSVQHLSLVLALEEKYGVSFEPEEMERMKSLGEIAGLLATKLRSTATAG